MKILLVSSYLPYPLLNGGNIRLYNLLKNLSKIHKITLICEKRDHQNENDIKEVEKVCFKVIIVPRKKQWSLKNILKTAFSFNPFLIVGHESPDMKKKIKEELGREVYDLIHVETSYVMQNVPKVHIPIVLTEHNVEYLVYERYANQSSLIIRPFLLFDVWKLKKKEKSFWKRSTKLVAVSRIEKDVMNADFVVPNGADIEKFKFQNPEDKIQNPERRILFIGDFRWIQNRDAIEWIIKDIWPEIKNQGLDAKLWVVGKRIPDRIKNLSADPSIIFDEEAPPDTYKIYENSFALLAPIRIGGGTSFKILEAMSCGLPVLTTNLGIQGIGAKDRTHVLVAENSKGFAGNISELIEDRSIYEEVVRNARKFVEENYSWDGIAEKLDNIYKSLV